MTPLRQGLVIYAAFFIHVMTHGILYSFGVIFIALEEKYGSNKADVAWIGSILTSMVFLSGPVAGYLTAKFGCRRVAIAGSLFGFLGYGFSIFVDKLHVLYLTMGILAGSGLGLLFLPAIVAVTQAFQKYRAVAVGLSLCGAGTGAFVFSPLQKWLLDTYAWKGTLLLNAAVLLNCLPFGLLLQQDGKNRNGKTTLQNFSNESVKNVDKETIINTFEIDCAIQTTNLSFNERNIKKTYSPESDNKQTDIRYTNAVDENDEYQLYKHTSRNEDFNYSRCSQISDDECVVQNGSYSLDYLPMISASNWNTGENVTFIKTINENGNGADPEIVIEEEKTLVKKKSPVEILEILRAPPFVLFAFSQFLYYFGLYLPFMLIPDRAKGLGIPEETSVWIVSTIGISSIVSRVVLGYMVDRLSINRGIFMTMTVLIGGLASAFVPVFVVVWMMFVYAAIYGICIGVTLSFISVVLADLLGIDKLNEAYGMNNFFCGIAVLLGPPIAGFLYDATGNYNATFIAAGSLQVIASMPLMLALLIKRK